MKRGRQQARVKLSVVVPAYNASATIDGCLSSLLAQTVPMDDYEIVVVDNGSTDDTAERAHRYPVTVMYEPDGTVYDARNAGVSASSGGVIAFTDSDCVADGKWLECGLQWLQQCDVVAGAIEPLPSARRLLYAYERYVYRKPPPQVEPNIAAGNAFIRRPVFERLEGFPKRLSTAGDSVFSTRAREEGYAIRYAASAIVYHPVDGWAHRLRGMMREGYGSEIKEVHRGGRRTSRLRNALMLVRNDLGNVRAAWARDEMDACVALGVVGVALSLRALAYGSVVTARAFGGLNRTLARR